MSSLKLEPIQTEFALSELNDDSPITFDTKASKFTFDLNALNKNGWTQLYEAVLHESAQGCLELLKKGADPNIKGKVSISLPMPKSQTEESPLYKAVEKESKDIVDLLLKYGANPNSALPEDITSLHCSIINNNVEITKLLLEHGANPNQPIKYSLQTPLHLAAKVNSNPELIRLLLAYKASASPVDKYDKKPIDYADSTEAKMLLSEAESNQLIQISETTNTYHENTVFTLENRLDSFMTKEEDISKGQCSSAGKHTDRPIKSNNNNISKVELPNDYINTVLSHPKSNDKADKDIVSSSSISSNEEEDRKCLNDSLENNMSYSRSKEEYISDFPLSSSKKPEESKELCYQRVITNKRLSFNNSKMSYHKKTPIDKFSKDESDKENIHPSKSNSFYNLTQRNTTTLLETCIQNCTERFLTSNGINLSNTDGNAFEANYNSTSKQNRGPSSNNVNSTGSTQPRSNKLNSFKSQKQFNSQCSDQELYGKVSDFSLKSVLPKRNIPSIYLSKVKAWLKQAKLSVYLPCFIDNEVYDYDKMLSLLHKSDTASQYAFFENIGIKKPGHIYRLLTKYALDAMRIEDRVVKFILPGAYHQRNESKTLEGNLKVSAEYCCGCNLFNSRNQLDLACFLNRKQLVHLHPNFAHNGFDLFEYVLLQMYTEYTITEDIMENSLHIYSEADRKLLSRSLIEEINKINLFVNTKEFNANCAKYKYETLNLESEAADKQCLSCVIY